MKINGLIIQKQNESLYKGVEGDNWYLNYCEHKELDEYFKDNIERAWNSNDYVDVCNDMGYIQKYIDISECENISYRVLACVTEKELPQMALKEGVNFLGYDYAYSGGSYYSAVLNDIISKRIPEFMEIQLNKNGLFDTNDEVEAFIHARNSLKYTAEFQSEYIEEGDFIKYKLYEVYI